ncbi:MAG: hypothetical protein CMF59_09585 [Leptospiraceae bacterium]|nr:hypothetical protein [Leptospiraceae bacterium]
MLLPGTRAQMLFLALISAIPLTSACQSGLEYQNPYGVSSVTLQQPAPPNFQNEDQLSTDDPNTENESDELPTENRPDSEKRAIAEQPENATLHPVPKDEKRPYPESRFATIDGVRIHFRWIPSDGGDRRYILIHGFAASTYSYRHTIHHLKNQGHEILAVDLPGYGFSDRVLEGSHSKFRRAELIWKLVHLLESSPSRYASMESPGRSPSRGIERWILVGHSMGGSVIAAMTQLYPENVEYLIYIAGSVDGGPGWFARNAVRWIPGLKGLITWYAESYSFNEESFKELLTSAYARPPAKEEVDGYLQPFLIPDTAPSILASIENSQDPRTLQMAQSNLPALLIWGDGDEWVVPEVGRALHQDIKLSLLYMIEGAGHCPMETHPEQVHRIMDKSDAAMRQIRESGPQ